MAANTARQPEEFIETIQEELSGPIKGKLMTMGEQLIQKGVQQGLVLGINQGEERILMHQLEQKFTHVSEYHRTLVEQADSETLLNWATRVLSAKTLEEIFD